MDRTEQRAADPLVGRVLDGRYRLTSLIARGGMAGVYLAVDDRLDRRVAVKVMRQALAEDPEFVARFSREARAAARLSAPEVVAVHDQGRDPETGLAFLVMEHVQGRTLRDLLRDRGALPVPRALSVLEPVLAALAAAHAAGIVHRDVKPENVLLGDDGRIKVADFGLARAVETSTVTLTTGLLLGTVAYLSPEQVEHGAADPRSDVYAAGIVLWECLTGFPPHDGDSPLQVAYRHVHADVPPPSTVVGGIPPELDDLVVRATRRDPALRPRDAGAFLAEVRALRGSALTAPRRHDTLVVPRQPGPSAPEAPPRPPPAPRRARRRRGLAVLALLLALLVGAGAWWLGDGRWTAAPGVLGTDLAAAEQRLQAEGLSVAVSPEERFDERVPAGAVVDQDPDPTDRVRRGGTVELVLSRGPDRRQVPAVAGSTEQAATEALAAVGLQAQPVTREYSPQPAGTVLSSDPPAGTALQPDSTVALVVSRGLELLPVPDTTGTPRAAAEARLKAAGFAPTVQEAYDDTVPAGSVVRQTPRSGTVARGGAVALVVSRGPELRRVPALVGTDARTARTRLEALGLVVEVNALPGGPGLVLRISPGEGLEVPRGSKVTLYVF